MQTTPTTRNARPVPPHPTRKLVNLSIDPISTFWRNFCANRHWHGEPGIRGAMRRWHRGFGGAAGAAGVTPPRSRVRRPRRAIRWGQASAVTEVSHPSEIVLTTDRHRSTRIRGDPVIHSAEDREQIADSLRHIFSNTLPLSGGSCVSWFIPDRSRIAGSEVTHPKLHPRGQSKGADS